VVNAAVEVTKVTVSRRANLSLFWVVIMVLAFGFTIATVAVLLCWCCYWQRRRQQPCCDVMLRRDVTGSSPRTAHDLLHSLVAPPFHKRILFMRNNILYSSGSGPPVKVCTAEYQFCLPHNFVSSITFRISTWRNLKFLIIRDSHILPIIVNKKINIPVKMLTNLFCAIRACHLS